MSNPSTHIQRQLGLVQSLLINPNVGNSKFNYTGYKTEHVYWRDFARIEPQDINFAYGGKSKFLLPLGVDKLGPIWLSWEQGALTTTGGTYRRFGDWLPLNMIQKIELKYGSNIVFRYQPEHHHYQLYHEYTSENRDYFSSIMAGNLTTAQRNTLAAGTQRVYLPIRFPFVLKPDMYMELRQLSIQPEVIVYWNTLPSAVQTDGTAPVSVVNDLHLMNTNLYFTHKQRDIYTKMIESQHGIVRLVPEHFVDTYDNTNQIIPAGTTGEFKLELKGIKGCLRYIALMIRPRNLINTDLAQQKYEIGSLYPSVKRWKIITGSNEEVISWLDRDFNTKVLHHMFYHGTPIGTNYLFYTWDDEPADHCNAKGTYNFQPLQNPQLVLDFGSTAVASDLVVTLIRCEFNTWQSVRGDIMLNLA